MAEAKNGVKYCPKCKKELPVSEFGKDRSTKDSLQVYCKICKSKVTKEQNKKRKDRGYKYIDKSKLTSVRKLLAMLKPYRKEQSL